MAENEVNLKVRVTSEGTDKLDQVDKAMGKLNKTTAQADIATQGVGESTQFYNTSLIKAMPQLQAVNPLMSGLGISTLITTGAVGLLGLGFLKLGQTVVATHGSLVDLGISLGQYTQGPVMTYTETFEQTVSMAQKLHATTAQTAAAFQVLTEATHDQGTAMTLLNEANIVSLDTGKSLKTVAGELAQAYSQGAFIQGKMEPAGLPTAEKLAGIMDTQKSGWAKFWQTMQRDFARGFDLSLPTGNPFNPKDWNFSGWSTSVNSGKSSGPISSSTPLVIQIDGKTIAQTTIDLLNGTLRIRGGY
jgi:hypothetical protein